MGIPREQSQPPTMTVGWCQLLYSPSGICTHVGNMYTRECALRGVVDLHSQDEVARLAGLARSLHALGDPPRGEQSSPQEMPMPVSCQSPHTSHPYTPDLRAIFLLAAHLALSSCCFVLFFCKPFSSFDSCGNRKNTVSMSTTRTAGSPPLPG